MTKRVEIPTLFKTHKLPTTRYQGSKYKLREWIKHSLNDLQFETAIDAFSGTSSIGYTLDFLHNPKSGSEIAFCLYGKI